MSKGKKKRKNSNYVTKKDLEEKDSLKEFEKGFAPFDYMKKPGMVIYLVAIVAVAAVLFSLRFMGVI